jgi:F-type H+-transporting ATPase subunit b
MNEVENAAHHEAVPGVPEPIQKLPTDVMQVSEQMILLTWLVFGIAAVCLHKLLWKPILGAVEKREQSISEALDGAEQARKDMTETQGRMRQVVDRATSEARVTAEQASREATATKARADQEAKALAQRRLAEAEREIGVEARKAAEAVRLDAAKHVGDVIERLLLKNLTAEQKQAYQADILREVKL